MPVALVTCREVPDLDPDDRLAADALAALGIEAVPAVWDDPSVDWVAFDLAVIRSTWDYATRRAEFVAWTHRAPRLANPAAVIAWNTDKRYLRELAAAGAPTVPTRWVAPGEPWEPESDGTWVIKPAVSAGGVDTGRYDTADGAQRVLAGNHVARLNRAGRTAMIQPYLHAIDEYGETALMYVGGPDGLRFSHAIRKAALLDGPDDGVAGLYRKETVEARTPTAAERRAADAVVATIPFADLLYARIDLVPSPDGPLLLELELTEPSLFFTHAPGSAERFAAAVAARSGKRFDGGARP